MWALKISDQIGVAEGFKLQAHITNGHGKSEKPTNQGTILKGDSLSSKIPFSLFCSYHINNLLKCHSKSQHQWMGFI